jgi:hypothetical protein
MDRRGRDGARQGIEELEGRHELCPIDQKRNVTDIENAMLHAVSILDSVEVPKVNFSV